jgi:hypothetical protein
MSMNIHAKPGTKVVFANPNNGNYHSQETARTYLEPGKVYTVARCDVEDWFTDVFLEEVPGIAFNSVMFDDAPQVTIERGGVLESVQEKKDQGGFVERLVIIQESGMYAGAPLPEMRIHELIPFNGKEFGKQRCALLNRHTDLPFYLTTALVRVYRGGQKEWKDADLEAEGLKPLED